VILFFLFFQNSKKKTDTVYQNHIARLEARSLRAQMNPHFIYNALNSLQSVMLLKGERETNRYIGMLFKLLRFPN
jgi:sensor histidine kinase YesM